MKPEQNLSVSCENLEPEDTEESLLMTFVKHTFSFVGGIAVTLLALIAAMIVKIVVSALR